ncbi:predicted protein [Uncinocarpus reesii 1704]|uniref:Uncharacterized protein n=1 Tax=Uncinocarpus reesii (strain UAMH 1704) TaxID=336963 RepID=C4JIG5_UNCRE|nr:uncharacterized protein UREG_01502 [Uncinocarpus reesii 1704]EEP76653.1 predicted protein [Uncinocarpus reesii 1704]
MFLARRSAAPARAFLRRHQPRRYAHSEAHHAEPVNESFGRGFYIAIASIPAGLALYKYSTSDSKNAPWITRLIEEYTPSENLWAKRNALHTLAVEKAASDRHLFHSQNPLLTIDLKYPEMFNAGSPINMPAGNSSGDLRAVISHYQKRQKAQEEDRLARMENGKCCTFAYNAFPYLSTAGFIALRFNDSGPDDLTQIVMQDRSLHILLGALGIAPKIMPLASSL